MFMMDYSDFFVLLKEVIQDKFREYTHYEYRQAKKTLRKYYKKDNFCTACGIMTREELEALVIVGEHERLKK